MADVFFIQQNFTVGDVSGNEKLLLTAARSARSAGAAVALSAELSLTGYCPNDLLFYPSFRRATEESLARIAAQAPAGLALLVGLPWWEDKEEGGRVYNACALIKDGAVAGVHKKSVLPNGSIFDERRYFTGADDASPLLFEADGEIYAVQICEEMWHPTAAEKIAQCRLDGRAVSAVLVPNASPFYVGKQKLREDAATAFAVAAGARVYYAHGIGGQDELVFDGASFVADGGGIIGRLPAFEDCNAAADLVTEYPDDLTAIYTALQCGLRDYVRKSAFAQGVLLGLSGGVDSALVATLAADALGKEAVMAVMLSTEFTTAESLQYAQALANNLQIEYRQLSLTETLPLLQKTLQPHLCGRKNDVTMENIQSRLRGLLLMALSNNRGAMLLATGNKSEIAYGYSTLYGDTNGGFAPIADVLKTQVWDLCRYRNAQENFGGREVIPTEIIERAPSAELRHDQADSDSLPSYELVDAMLTDHLNRLSRDEMAKKYEATMLTDFYRRLIASEYKRQQIPIGVKISLCAFGWDWRMPVANRYCYD